MSAIYISMIITVIIALMVIICIWFLVRRSAPPALFFLQFTMGINGMVLVVYRLGAVLGESVSGVVEHRNELSVLLIQLILLITIEILNTVVSVLFCRPHEV